MEIEQIKKNIADELRKQYLELIQNEGQVLGDMRDLDVKDQEKIEKELDELIFEGQKKKEILKQEENQEDIKE